MKYVSLMELAGVKSFFHVVPAALLCASLLACGGGGSTVRPDRQPGEEVDIDRLLGGEDQSSQQTSDEDEVLRLLGLVPDTTKAVALKESPAAAPVTPEPKPEVERLQRELQEKNQMIAELQADVGAKEKRIQALQADLEKAQRSATSAGTESSRAALRGDYAQRYAAARDLYEQRRYREAIQVFSALLAENDKNSLADNSQYWIGESYYGLGNFAQAIVEFEKVFTFPRSDKTDDAHLKIGLCYLRIGDRQQARSEFEQLLANYPNSEYVGKARYYLSKL